MNPAIINITNAEHLGDYRIRLRFDDGTEQTVDFLPFLSHAQHPDIRNLLNHVQFSSFRVEYGELIWGDYDLCFPMIDLYRNQIVHHVSLEEVA